MTATLSQRLATMALLEDCKKALQLLHLSHQDNLCADLMKHMEAVERAFKDLTAGDLNRGTKKRTDDRSSAAGNRGDVWIPRGREPFDGNGSKRAIVSEQSRNRQGHSCPNGRTGVAARHGSRPTMVRELIAVGDHDPEPNYAAVQDAVKEAVREERS